ncbi:MAG TPA: zinc ribbon domain-containing protein [Candidatus Hydrogenedentes bacterium]|nr:zinc ribbon domain-containing protein [Candidatus Hydrogenedentota bacterium]
MPLFGYVCESCEHEHELLVRSDAHPECPDCGSAKMVKLMSAFAPQGSRRAENVPSSCGAQMCCGMRGGCGMN